MEWSIRLTQKREFKPLMPPQSGLTLPEDKKGRIPVMYFCIVGENWQPRIIDDSDLRQRLLPGFTRMRDLVIASILFDSGARINQVLGLTLEIGEKRGNRRKH